MSLEGRPNAPIVRGVEGPDIRVCSTVIYHVIGVMEVIACLERDESELMRNRHRYFSENSMTIQFR